MPWKVKFRMDDYVSSIPEEAPSDMKGVAVAANHPFTTHKDALKLGDENAEVNWCFTSYLFTELLYLCK